MFFGSVGCAIAPTKEGIARNHVKELKSNDAEVRRKAALELGKLGVPETVPALAEALKDTNPRVRRNAAFSLTQFGEQSRPAMQALKDTMEIETDSWAILNMASALDGLGVNRNEMVPALRRVIQGSRSSGDLEFRFKAAVFLHGSVDPVEVFPIFLETIGTEVESSAKNRPFWLVSDLVKTQDKRFITPLLHALRQGNPAQRAGAAVFLPQFKPLPREVGPALIIALRDPNAEVREGAARGLNQIGGQASLPKETVQRLVEALKDPEENVSRSAAEALSTGRAHAKIVVPALIEALQDPRARVRAASAESIRLFGPIAREAIPSLIKTLKQDKDREVIEAVCRALSSMGPLAKEAIPLLKSALESPDPYIRNWASFPLEKIDLKQ
jgi:HEAT repeat protein